MTSTLILYCIEPLNTLKSKVYFLPSYITFTNNTMLSVYYTTWYFITGLYIFNWRVKRAKFIFICFPQEDQLLKHCHAYLEKRYQEKKKPLKSTAFKEFFVFLILLIRRCREYILWCGEYVLWAAVYILWYREYIAQLR